MGMYIGENATVRLLCCRYFLRQAISGHSARPTYHAHLQDLNGTRNPIMSPGLPPPPYATIVPPCRRFDPIRTVTAFVPTTSALMGSSIRALVLPRCQQGVFLSCSSTASSRFTSRSRGAVHTMPALLKTFEGRTAAAAAGAGAAGRRAWGPATATKMSVSTGTAAAAPSADAALVFDAAGNGATRA